MRTPFSAEQFFDVFTRYNETVWPMQLLLFGLGLLLTGIAMVLPRASRLVMGGLAALWAWMAIGYHFAFFADINPAARIFGALFLVEAALLAWHGLRTRRLHVYARLERPRMVVGGVLAAWALIGYPMLALGVGQRYPALPTFGLPCPTVIFTFALLTWSMRPVPWTVLVIPSLWALLGFSAATSLGVAEDFTLLPAALLALAVIYWPKSRWTRRAPADTRPLQLGF